MRTALRTRNEPCLGPRGRIREPYLSDPWRTALRDRNEPFLGPLGQNGAPYLSDSWRIARRSKGASSGPVGRLWAPSSSRYSYDVALNQANFGL
jgi:hypothetical protein